MKKLILSMALLAGLAIVSCSKDDDGGNGNCVTCSMQGQSVEICKAENGNATAAGQEFPILFDEYIDGLEEAGADCN